MIKNKFNLLSLVFIAGILISFLKWSNYYTQSLSLQFYLFICALILLNFFFGLIDNILTKSNIQKIHITNKDNRTVSKLYIFDFLAFSYMIANFFYTGTSPITELISGGDYKNIDQLFGYSLFFLPLCIARFIYLYDNKTSKKDFFILTGYFLFFLINISRIIVFILLIIVLCKRYFFDKDSDEFKFRKIFNMRLVAIGLLIVFIFGFLGEFRSQDYQADTNSNENFVSIVRLIGDPSESFDNAGINDNFLWFYLYAVSPLYNLDQAITYRHKSFSYDTLLKSITPNFISGNLLDIYKDKSFLVVDTFNTSTIYGEIIYTSNLLIGILFHIYICILILFVTLLTKNHNSNSLKIFINTSFALSFFSGVILKEIFIITIFFSILIHFIANLNSKPLNKS